MTILREHLIREYIRHYIREVRMSDYFGQSFNEFKDRTSQGEDPISVADELFTRIGQGSHRVTYEIPENKDHVVKVVNTLIAPGKDQESGRDERGFTKDQKISANRFESDLNMQQKYSDIFPRTFEVAPDRSWILSERVNQVDRDVFYKFLGLSDEGQIENIAFQALVELIIEHFKNESDPEHWSHPFFISEEDEDIKTLAIHEQGLNATYDTMPMDSKVGSRIRQEDIPVRVLQSPMARRVRKMIQDPHNEKIFRTMASLGIPAREFRPDNLGVSTVGTPRLVLLDASLWEDGEAI
jgi:hypothetical protein